LPVLKTTKPGKSCDSLPSPYVTHEPMLGRPNCWDPVVHEDLGRGVVERVGVQRFDDGDVVRHLRQVRQQLRQFGPALPVFGKLEFRPEERGIRVDERGPVAFQKVGWRQLAVHWPERRAI